MHLHQLTDERGDVYEQPHLNAPSTFTAEAELAAGLRAAANAHPPPTLPKPVICTHSFSVRLGLFSVSSVTYREKASLTMNVTSLVHKTKEM